MFILFLHLIQIFQGHLLWWFFILFCLVNYFVLNSCFTFLLTVLFYNLTVFCEETLFFAWLKKKKKMFALDLKTVSFIKYIWYKNIQMECRKSFHKKVACWHVLKRTCYFYFVTLWLDALYTFEMWLDE